MSIDPEQLRIVHYPHPVLRGRAKAVQAVTDEIRRVAERMIDLMHEAPGVGLAAPQVGLDWRLFVANPTGDPGDDHVYINPELSGPSRETEVHEEGCLSLPEIHGDINRPVAITIRALDMDGNPFEQTAEGLPARVWQHEFDHLQGVLIIDRMSALDKMANKRMLREMERAAK